MDLCNRCRSQRRFIENGNISATGLPNCVSIICFATAPENGATWSRSLASSSAISGGIKSRRVDSIWPNFTKIGPNSCNAKRKRSPRGRLASSDRVGVNGFSNHSHFPNAVSSSKESRRWRNNTRAMRTARKVELMRLAPALASIFRNAPVLSRRDPADHRHLH